MAISPEEVKKVAMLARLGLSDAEVEHMAVEMSAILGYIDKLNQLDTTGVQPNAVSANQNTLRPDLARPSLPLEAVLANAPQTAGEFIRFVPIMPAVKGQSPAEALAAVEADL